MKKVIKEPVENFVSHTKKPLFILGAIFWIGLFVFIFSNSFSKVVTGHSIVALNSIGGFSSTSVLIGLFLILSVLLFLIWKFILCAKKKCKKRKYFIK
ncbi:hypothetical protein GW932_01965 [archaeon]|nr:hypothetical protein [archaeon]